MRITINLLLALISLPALSQFSIGTWRDHFSYIRCVDVCEAGDLIYSATRNGLYTYSKSSGEIVRINKTTVLSDVGISSLDYDPVSGLIIVGYSNGNLDLLSKDGVYNIPLIKFSTLVGDKTIYDILSFGDFLYLCTGFGVVVIDVPRKEIKETYFIGTSGEPVKVKDIAIHNDIIYALTEQGLRTANVNDSFLSNFANWGLFTSLPNSVVPSHIEFFNNEMILSVPGAENDTVWSRSLDAENWTQRFPLEFLRVNDLWSNGEWFALSGTNTFS